MNKHSFCRLNYHLDQILTTHLSQFEQMPHNEYEHLVEHLQLAYAHKELLRTLKKQNLSDMVLTKYNEFVLKINNSPTNSTQRITIAFKVGGFWNVILAWLDEEPMTSPEELAHVLMKFITDGLTDNS